MAFPQTDNRISPDRNVARLRSAFRRQLWKTVFFALAAVAVIAVGSIAWFVSNTQVQSGTAAVSAAFETVRLATDGKQQSDLEWLLNLSDGTPYTYDDVTYYYTEGETIALRLSGETVVSPGASGTVNFYILPTRDGAATIPLYVDLAGYVKNGEDSAVRVNDPVLDALLSGHILLFGSYTDGHYSDWLFQPDTGSNTITVTLPEDSKTGVPEPVTLYWIWPLRYENMEKDLYAEEHTVFQDFLDDQATNLTLMNENSKHRYHYSRIFLTNEIDLSAPSARSKAYNQADEYIGGKADYLYLTIQTSAVSDGGKEAS